MNQKEDGEISHLNLGIMQLVGIMSLDVDTLELDLLCSIFRITVVDSGLFRFQHWLRGLTCSERP